MIVVDTSVVVAIVRREEEESIFTEILDQSSAAIMSAVSYAETYMVVIGRRAKIEGRIKDCRIGDCCLEY